MGTKDASNINATGFTIDLANLNSMKLSNDHATVNLGPGLRWGAVYEYLTPHGLTVVGGRASGVCASYSISRKSS